MLKDNQALQQSLLPRIAPFLSELQRALPGTADRYNEQKGGAIARRI